MQFSQAILVHACNPGTWEAEAEDGKFKASLGNPVRPCLKKEKDRDVA